MEYGIDTYYDMIDSHAWITLDDISYTKEQSRGQYLDGSRYLYGGMFVSGKADITSWIRLNSGARFSWIGAWADADPESGSSNVDRRWFPFVWNAGITAAPKKKISLVVNIDRSFRAPNLDDLTSRQQTGPGFQFENASLKPEKSTTYETGLKLSGVVNAEIWGFITQISDAIVRAPKSVDECPVNTPGCNASWNRFQLENASGKKSLLRGLEGSLAISMPGGLSTKASIAWTWGEGPNTADPPSDPSVHFDKTVPLSRVPPLNGTVEFLWKSGFGFSSGAALRWAASQTRLALSDVSDERIPPGGTPGFAVVDLRCSYRPDKNILASITLENLFDTAYRYHGSSINGPGRGIMFMLDIGPVWK
jgi:iron complex outermembrane receptor protein/hemoglobin/transferrin/lactoferrin receptor protein